MRSLPILLALLALPTLQAEKKTIIPAEMAGSKSPFSPGILVDGTLYVAGQMGRDSKTNTIPTNFEQEVKSCLDNIGLILKAANMTYSDVVSVTIYMTDMDLFAKMNAVYTTYFPEPRPVRATVGVAKLAAPNGHLEISVIAHK